MLAWIIKGNGVCIVDVLFGHYVELFNTTRTHCKINVWNIGLGILGSWNIGELEYWGIGILDIWDQLFEYLIIRNCDIMSLAVISGF